MAISQEDLTQAGMNFYLALIHPDRGLDASGPLYYGYSDLFQLEYAKKYIPAIFDNNGNVPRSEEQEMKKEAHDKATELARESGTGGAKDAGIIMMRKQLAPEMHEAEVFAAPIPKNFFEKIRDKGDLQGALDFLHMATHVIKGKEMVHRSETDDIEDMIDDIELKIETKKKKEARKKKRKHT
jgi:hypothetical protein